MNIYINWHMSRNQFLIDLYVGLGSDIFWSVSFEILITY